MRGLNVDIEQPSYKLNGDSTPLSEFSDSTSHYFI
jgi:hypothetical protein